MKSLVLTNGQTPLTLGFDADVRGTASDETIRVKSGADVEFGGQEGDRVELAGALADYNINTSGNTITFARGDTQATVALNGDTEIAFDDGSATAGIKVEEGGPKIQIGGETVDDSFNASAVSLSGNGSNFDNQDGDETETVETVRIPPTPTGESVTFDASDGPHRFVTSAFQGSAANIQGFSQDDQVVFEDLASLDDLIPVVADEDDGSPDIALGTLPLDATSEVQAIRLEDVLDDAPVTELMGFADVNDALGFQGAVAA